VFAITSTCLFGVEAPSRIASSISGPNPYSRLTSNDCHLKRHDWLFVPFIDDDFARQPSRSTWEDEDVTGHDPPCVLRPCDSGTDLEMASAQAVIVGAICSICRPIQGSRNGLCIQRCSGAVDSMISKYGGRYRKEVSQGKRDM
jgi:hypothetical protein